MNLLHFFAANYGWGKAELDECSEAELEYLRFLIERDKWQRQQQIGR